MRLSGAGVKRFYNPVKLNFTEWGNWEAIILEAVGNRKALLMTVRRGEEVRVDGDVWTAPCRCEVNPHMAPYLAFVFMARRG